MTTYPWSDWTPYRLANEAGVNTPDSPESAGSRFLLRVAANVAEWLEENPGADEDDQSDAAHMASDEAVPTYTGELWQAFADLAGWQAWDEYVDEFGDERVSNAHGDGMTARAAVALWFVGERLAQVLFGEYRDAADETEDDDEGDA